MIGSQTPAAPFLVIRIPTGLDRVSPVASLRRLLVHCEDYLLSVREVDLLNTMSALTGLDLRSLAGTLKVASQVDLSDAWTVNPINGTVAILGQDMATIIPLDDTSERRETKVAAMPPSARALALDNESSLLVCESFQVNDPDFGQNDAVCIDLNRGDVLDPGTITSTDSLEAAWVEECDSFLVHDCQNATLWRWQPLKGAPLIIDESVPGDLRPTASAFDASGRFLTKVLQDSRGGGSQLAHGDVAENSVSWRAPVPLPEGEYESVVWHPSGQVLACVRTVGRHVYLSVMDARAQMVDECPLPPTCQGNGLVWSGDGQCVYAAGQQAIGIWKL